jgi:hypothetical protein
VTEIANRLLHIKQARFGSVDRESSLKWSPILRQPLKIEPQRQ